jgi:hypothetical protein
MNSQRQVMRKEVAELDLSSWSTYTGQLLYTNPAIHATTGHNEDDDDDDPAACVEAWCIWMCMSESTPPAIASTWSSQGWSQHWKRFCIHPHRRPAASRSFFGKWLWETE